MAGLYTFYFYFVVNLDSVVFYKVIDSGLHATAVIQTRSKADLRTNRVNLLFCHRDLIKYRWLSGSELPVTEKCW